MPRTLWTRSSPSTHTVASRRAKSSSSSSSVQKIPCVFLYLWRNAIGVVRLVVDNQHILLASRAAQDARHKRRVAFHVADGDDLGAHHRTIRPLLFVAHFQFTRRHRGGIGFGCEVAAAARSRGLAANNDLSSRLSSTPRLSTRALPGWRGSKSCQLRMMTRPRARSGIIPSGTRSRVRYRLASPSVGFSSPAAANGW